MFEDQTIELLPARTTLQAGAGGNGGWGGDGGGALAASTAVVIVYGDVIDSEITVTAGDATATGGNGGAGGAGGWGGDDND